MLDRCEILCELRYLILFRRNRSHAAEFVESRDMSLQQSFGDVQTHIDMPLLDRNLCSTLADPSIWDFPYLKGSTCVKEVVAHGVRTL